MAAPALYYRLREMTFDKPGILSGVEKVMKDLGMTGVKRTQNETSGRTSNVHAFVAALHKKDPPSPGPGLGTTAPPTYTLVFVAAGSGAKEVVDKIVAGWDKLNFL
jgi:hypothetical protein